MTPVKASLGRWVGVAMLALVSVSTTGCSAIAVALGLRVRLDSVPVTVVSASLVDKRSGPVVSALGPDSMVSGPTIPDCRGGRSSES